MGQPPYPLCIRGRYLEPIELEGDNVNVCFRFTGASASPQSSDVWLVSWLWESPTLNTRDRPWKGQERHAQVCLWLHQLSPSGRFLRDLNHCFEWTMLFAALPAGRWGCSEWGRSALGQLLTTYLPGKPPLHSSWSTHRAKLDSSNSEYWLLAGL